MFGNTTNSPKIDMAQHEMFETAQHRIKQKKRLFFHLVVYVLGGVFMFVINKLLGYGQADWFVWAILAWTFFFLIHVINVFITDRFLGREWQRKEREKLVALQQKKLLKMQAQVEKEFEKQKEEAQRAVALEAEIQQKKENL